MFGKKKPDTSSIATLVGAGTTVTGDLQFRGGLHLDGRIVGDVIGEVGAGSKLTLGTGGVIEGSVVVDELVLGGTVQGDVTGREKVELGASARVDGNVTYKALQMAAGARVNGRLIHQPGGQQAPAPPAGQEQADAGAPADEH
jgi:cytoskeletal protein CcmA (bactofilin family)